MFPSSPCSVADVTSKVSDFSVGKMDEDVDISESPMSLVHVDVEVLRMISLR